MSRKPTSSHKDMPERPGGHTAGGEQRRPVEVIALFGPTASGKSAVAEATAELLGTEIVSADALQVYRGLPILTNQPTTPTRLVGIRWPGRCAWTS